MPVVTKVDKKNNKKTMFRCTAIFPVLLSLAAFVLSVLVLLAGGNRGFLPDVYVIKIDTSQIGTNSNITQLLVAAGINPNDTGIAALDSILANLSEQEVGQLLNTAAHELGLHDFYTAHTLTWCEGTLLSPDANANTTSTPATANATAGAIEKVTSCSAPTFPFAFDPVRILETELLKGLTLAQVGFPTAEVDNVTRALQMAYKAMSICYLVGAILAGLAVLTGLCGFAASRPVEMLNQLLGMLSFLALGVASGIATAIAIKARDVFNQKAAAVNVSAEASTKFLAMTWAATAAMLVVVLLWCCVCCCGSHSRRRRTASPEPYTVEEEKAASSRWGRFGRRRSAVV